MKSLAFQIVNDLLFAGVIVEDVFPGEVQNLVQARLSQDRRLRDVMHLAHAEGHMYAGQRICGGAGRSQHVTLDPTEVTCLHCLNMHCMRDLAAEAERARDEEQGK